MNLMLNWLQYGNELTVPDGAGFCHVGSGGTNTGNDVRGWGCWMFCRSDIDDD